MSVKKLLLLSAAGLASLAMTSALAGGPEPMPAAENGVYVDVNGGYALVDWAGNFSGSPVSFGSNKNGGFTFGADLGYQWNRYLAAEVAWYYLPRVRFSDSRNNINGRITSWYAYAAIKLMAPVSENWKLFFKGGVALRYLRAKENGFSDSTSPVRPMFAAGIQWEFVQNWTANFQYIYLPSINNAGPAPAVNSFTLGIGYLFAL